MFKTTSLSRPATWTRPTTLFRSACSRCTLDAPSVGGWDVYLAGRGITVVVDDIGRKSITRSDARRLFDERREAEARQQEDVKRRDGEIGAQRVAGLRRGVPWYEVPDGVLPVVAMTAADRDAQPKRLSPLQEQLAGETMTYHRLPSTDEE